jgi:hypothetical protein
MPPLAQTALPGRPRIDFLVKNPECRTIPMEKSDLNANESLDFRDLISSGSPSGIEAACLYEYMRESQTLRDAVSGEGKSNQGLPSPFLPNLTLSELGRLIALLQSAGFPQPWKKLSKRFQTLLVSLLVTGAKRPGDTKSYPPVIIEQGWPEFDYSENRWRVGQLEPFELSLFREWEHSGRRYFFGFIRIDRSYNETEAGKAFRAWFKDHWRETKGGGSPKWHAKLNHLVVMRLSKRFPDPFKRVEHVAKFTTAGFKGCKEWRSERSKAKKAKLGLVDQRMSKAANEEMSSARADALKFFQSLFPGEMPLSY